MIAQCLNALMPSASSLSTLMPTDVFIADVLIFAVVLAAFAFSVAWFAEQRDRLTETVSCRCGKRQVVGIAPRARPDFGRLLTANCPSCQSGCATAVSAVPNPSMPNASMPNAYILQPSVSYLGDHDGE